MDARVESTEQTAFGVGSCNVEAGSKNTAVPPVQLEQSTVTGRMRAVVVLTQALSD